jgi:hypothetical protein
MLTSSAETGSSRIMTCGRSASARAMPMRCRCPPENSPGKRTAESGSRPTFASSSRTRPARPAILCTISGSPTISPTDSLGLSEEYGSWKTICRSRRSGRSAASLSPVSSAPLSLTLPEVGRSSRMSSRATVDLPQPDSPTRPRHRPECRSRLTPLTACTVADERSLVPRTRNSFVSSRTVSTSRSGPGDPPAAGSTRCPFAALPLSGCQARRIRPPRGCPGAGASAAKWHAAVWPGATGSNRGSAAHCSAARGQRGANAQPGP